MTSRNWLDNYVTDEINWIRELRRVPGFWPSLGGTNYARCRCVFFFSMFDFLSVLKTRRMYVNSGRLLADHILQHIGSERSDPIREMHFWTFSVFLCFQTWGGYVDFKTFFDTSRAQLRQGKPAQVKLGRVERHRPAGLIHPNTRSPAPWRPVYVKLSIIRPIMLSAKVWLAW